MTQREPTTITSQVVPTEYDIERESLELVVRNPLVSRLNRTWTLPLSTRVSLIDDRGRRFRARTLAKAFTKAERAQDASDPIHHPPYPSPLEVPTP